MFFGAVLLGFWLLFKGVFGMLGLRLFTFSILLRLGNLSVVLRLTVRVFAVLCAVKNRDDWKIIGIALLAERASSPNLMDNIGAFVFFGLILVFFLVAAFYRR